MTKLTTDARRGDATREALISAATQIFGRDGFDAATTRSIADAAGVQQALISYHFRSKDGLYLAVFEHIAGQLQGRLGPLAETIEHELDKPSTGTTKEALRDHHLALLLQMIDGALALTAQDETALWVQLMVREQREPTRAFQVLYEGFSKRILGLMTRLALSVRGGSDQDARLYVLQIVGQMLMFLIGRAGALRLLGWSAIGDKELAIIQAHFRESIPALLARPEQSRRPRQAGSPRGAPRKRRP